MRLRFIVLSAVLPVLALTNLASCSDDASSGATPEPGADASTSETDGGSEGTDSGGEPKDDGGDESLPVQNETEPNDAKTKTDFGKMTIPGVMNGKIDPAGDTDGFSITPAPGEFWEWTLAPTGADLMPRLTIADLAEGSLNPNVVVSGATAGSPLVVQHFVLRPGTFVVAAQDARNPAGAKGGPTFGYSLTARKKAPTPVAVTFPSTKTSTLASLGSVDLYTFTGTGGKGWDVVIRAKRKAAPSTLDSRMSIYDLTTKKAIITNDDAPSTTDSELGSDQSFPNTYMVIVDNEGTNGADLSYEIEFKLRP